MERLSSKFKCKTIKSGETLLARKEKQVDRDDTAIEEGLEKLREQYDW